jgi:hypothetical protein
MKQRVNVDDPLEGSYDKENKDSEHNEEWYKKTDWWEGVIADFDRRTAEVCIRIGKEPSEEKTNKKNSYLP